MLSNLIFSTIKRGGWRRRLVAELLSVLFFVLVSQPVLADNLYLTKIAEVKCEDGVLLATSKMSPDGKLIAIGCGLDWVHPKGYSIGEVRVWSIAEKKFVLTLKGHKGLVTALAFSPDGKQLASAGRQDNAVRIWDVGTGKLLATLSGWPGPVCSIDFGPAGKHLAASNSRRYGLGPYPKAEVRIWDLGSYKLQSTLKDDRDDLRCIKYSPDGKKLAVCAEGFKNNKNEATDIVLWDILTEKQSRVFSGHTSGVFSIGFSEDGKTLFSGAGKLADNKLDWVAGDVKAWAVEDNAAPKQISAHGLSTTALNLVPNKPWIAIGILQRSETATDYSADLIFVDLVTKKTILSEEWFIDVAAIQFSKDGKRMLVEAGGGKVFVYLLEGLSAR